MKTNTRGSILLIVGVVLLIGALGTGFGYLAGHKSSPSAPTAAGKAVLENEAAQAANNKAIGVDKANVAKTGQQFTTAAAISLSGAPPDVQSDPHVVFANRTLALGENAFDNSLGPLTPAQLDWAAQLVSDHFGDAARIAKSDAALATKTAELSSTVDHVKALEADNVILKGENTGLINELISHDAAASAFRFKVIAFCGVALGIWFFIAIGLPILAKAFPFLGAAETAAHAVLAPFAAKALAEAKNLGTDASAALQSVTAIVEKEAPAALTSVKAEVGSWITEADGIATQFRAALKRPRPVA